MSILSGMSRKRGVDLLAQLLLAGGAGVDRDDAVAFALQILHHEVARPVPVGAGADHGDGAHRRQNAADLRVGVGNRIERGHHSLLQAEVSAIAHGADMATGALGVLPWLPCVSARSPLTASAGSPTGSTGRPARGRRSTARSPAPARSGCRRRSARMPSRVTSIIENRIATVAYSRSASAQACARSPDSRRTSVTVLRHAAARLLGQLLGEVADHLRRRHAAQRVQVAARSRLPGSPCSSCSNSW